jgi:hypothetical protein
MEADLHLDFSDLGRHQKLFLAASRVVIQARTFGQIFYLEQVFVKMASALAIGAGAAVAAFLVCGPPP